VCRRDGRAQSHIPTSPTAPAVTAEPTTPTPTETTPTEVETTTPEEEETTPAQREPSARCLESWQQFGAIDDLQDSLKDVVPTLFACANVNEWIQAGEATPGHSLIVARLTAENLCRGQEGAQGAPVCKSLKS
jgi:hypothetical protein